MTQARKPVRRTFTGLVGMPSESKDSKPATTTAAVAVATISEDEVRRAFGVDSPASKRPEIPKSFRVFFQLEPEDLMAFFSAQIGTYTVFEQVEVVVSKDVLQRRLDHMQCVINERKKIVDGLAVHVMKIPRGKDNVLDKDTREKYKREETARLTKLYAKRARYRAAVASSLDYREKVWRTVARPLYFRDAVDDEMIFDKALATMFVNGEWTPVITRGSFDLESYRAVMRLDSFALDVLDGSEEAWDNLRVWENCVIAAAVAYRIIRPRRDLGEFLGLTKVVADLNDQVKLEDAEQRDMNPEDVLALKTGGRCYGGQVRIQSEGFRYRADGKPRARALSSFDKPTRMTVRGEISRN